MYTTFIPALIPKLPTGRAKNPTTVPLFIDFFVALNIITEKIKVSNNKKRIPTIRMKEMFYQRIYLSWNLVPLSVFHSVLRFFWCEVLIRVSRHEDSGNLHGHIRRLVCRSSKYSLLKLPLSEIWRGYL